MEHLLEKLDPFTGLLVLAVAALYYDSRTDRGRYLQTLNDVTDALGSIKAELAMLSQSVKNLRHRSGDHD